MHNNLVKINKKNSFNTTLIQKNIPLHDKNWFGTGGPAKFFCEPTTSEQLQDALQFAHQNQLPVFVLGHGANILISDAGFDGLVIRPQLTSIIIENGDSADYSLVTAQAGASFAHLIEFCLNNNLIGLEEFSGIPGTVGGSVFINIHFFEFLLSKFLTKATVIHKETGTLETVDNSWFNFGYDYSTLHDKPYYVVDATFKLKKVSEIEAAYSRGRSHEMIRYRSKRYPPARTCGSFFRNFFDYEVTLESNGKKMIFVAYYLDKLGVKGQLSYGNAIVSYQHANMIVSRDNATSTDIITLARTMQTMVKEEFGILPQPECQLIGFKEYPLL